MRRPSVDEARRAAFDTLLAVDRQSAFANLYLPGLLRERRLDKRDAAFATEIGYGALRWQGVLDEVIAVGARRSVHELDPPVRAALRLAAYQLLHTRVPAHAAVSSGVELARAAAGERVVGFTNAVLRRVSERDWAGWVDSIAPADDVGRVAFASGYPRWIADVFLERLDGNFGELALALAEDRPVTHLVARPGRITRDELLAQAGPDAEPGPWSPFAVRLPAGDPAQLDAVRAGRAGVQDEGSQLVALPLARAGDPGQDTWWLDLCAGPGGKAALLTGLLPDGARLLAVDLHQHRAGLVVRSVPVNGPAAVVVADATVPAWRMGRFDRVLLDAPCSGLGALRRRPEARWRRSPRDVEALGELQTRLLAVALDSVRPGGFVAYVTCSPHPAETVDVVAALRRARPDVEAVDVRPHLPDLPQLGPGPDVQLWPHRHGTDAMYLALLRSGDRVGQTEP